MNADSQALPPGAADATRGTGGIEPPPRVLVIVVHWNGYDATASCLESLLRLTYTHHRLLVIDNGSEDGSGERLRARFPDIDIHRSDDNLLYAGGANLGLQRAVARGDDFAVILNNDTEVAPDLLEQLLEVARRDEKIGLLGPKIFYTEPRNLIWSAGGRIDLWSGLTHHLGLRRPDGPEFQVERDVDYVTGCCIMARRQLLVDVGYLDTSYYMYSEDADWSARSRARGYRVSFAPRAHVWHAVSAASGGGTTAYKTYHRVRSNLLFLTRHARPYHWLTIPFLMPFHVFGLAWREIRRGNGRVVTAGLRALLDLVLRAPRRAP